MKSLILLACTVLLIACTNRGLPEVNDRPAAEQIQADQIYAHIFKPWDGKWKGQFYTFSATQGQQAGKAQPKQLSLDYFNELDLQQTSVIEVEQEYVSESPFFQKVRIKDTYKTGDGETRTEVSTGVNKVEGGKIWCIVHKTDETVIHRGNSVGKQAISWERHLPNPLKVEYFWETILENTYTIIGWGYYGEDKLNLSPQTWFYGRYEREK